MFQRSSDYLAFKVALQEDNLQACQSLVILRHICKNQALVLAIHQHAFRIASWLIHGFQATLIRYDNYQELVDLTIRSETEWPGIISYQWLSQHFPNELSQRHRELFFLEATSSGRLKIAMWCHREWGIDFASHHYMFFRVACTFGHLEMAKWIFQECRDARVISYEAVTQAVIEGHLDIVKWILSTVKPDTNIHQSGEKLLRLALKKRHHDITIFLIESFQANPLALRNQVDDALTSPNEALELVVYLGDSRMIRYFIDYYHRHHSDWNVHLNDDFLLITSGLIGNPDCLEMIYQVDVAGFDERRLRYCFSEVIMNHIRPREFIVQRSDSPDIQGNLDWFWDKLFLMLDAQKLDFIHEQILLLIEKPDHFLPRIKWILEKHPRIDLHYQEDAFFITACRMGRLTTAKFLYERGLEIDSPIYVRIGGDVAFYCSIQDGYQELSSWLADIEDAYYFMPGAHGSSGSFEIHGEDDDWYEDQEWLELATFKKMRIEKITAPEKEVCNICLDCLDSLDSNEQLKKEKMGAVKTNCGHWFCDKDFFCWITEKQRMICPVCRQRFRLSECIYCISDASPTQDISHQ